MCLKLVDIKAKIDKLKLSPKTKTWIIVGLIALIPLVWTASSEWKNYQSNDQIIKEIPEKIDNVNKEVKKGNQENKNFIIQSNNEIISIVDKKFGILIDNIEFNNKELLKQAIQNQKVNQYIIQQQVIIDTVQVNTDSIKSSSNISITDTTFINDTIYITKKDKFNL